MVQWFYGLIAQQQYKQNVVGPLRIQIVMTAMLMMEVNSVSQHPLSQLMGVDHLCHQPLRHQWLPNPLQSALLNQHVVQRAVQPQTLMLHHRKP